VPRHLGHGTGSISAFLDVLLGEKRLVTAKGLKKHQNRRSYRHQKSENFFDNYRKGPEAKGQIGALKKEVAFLREFRDI
jgi:hypothetical protein